MATKLVNPEDEDIDEINISLMPVLDNTIKTWKEKQNIKTQGKYL